MTFASSSTALLLLPCLGAAQLAYAPAPSTKDKLTWEVEHTLELASISVELGSGQTANIPEIEMRATRSRALTLAQTHVATQDGAPVALERRFEAVAEELEGSLVIPDDGLNETVDAVIEAPLEGRTVRLRTSDDGEVEAVFVDEDGTEHAREPELLEGLTADAHLGGLLDDAGDAEEGAAWSADASALRALLTPAGDLGAPIEYSGGDERGFEPIAAGLDPLLGMDLGALLDGELEGGIRCSVKEVREGGLVVISLEVDVQATANVLERVKDWVDPIQAQMECEVTGATAFSAFGGEGELTWNTETGLATALELTLDLEYRLEREADLVLPDGQAESVATEIELEGEVRAVLSAE